MVEFWVIFLCLSCMFKIAEGFQKPVFFHSQPYQHKKDGSFYDIIEKDSEGRDFEFRQFKGKVVYGVNVASKCGYTASGYALIAKLLKLRDQGVEVALFPCNQFGGQEPGIQSEIADFCFRKGVGGANLFMKGDVNGPDTRPTYRFLKDNGVLGDVAWNFAGKFLIDRHGNARGVKSEKNLEIDIKSMLL